MNMYLVFLRMPDFMDTKKRYEDYCDIMTTWQIFDRMDIADCSDEEITAIYLLRPENKRKLVKAEFHGVWHEPRDPLKMSITVNGKEIDCGYGTDH